MATHAVIYGFRQHRDGLAIVLELGSRTIMLSQVKLQDPFSGGENWETYAFTCRLEDQPGWIGLGGVITDFGELWLSRKGKIHPLALLRGHGISWELDLVLKERRFFQRPTRT